MSGSSSHSLSSEAAAMNTAAAASADSSVDEAQLAVFSGYLLSLLPLLLSASGTDLRRTLLASRSAAGISSSSSSSSGSSYASLVTRFINESSLQSIYINKVRPRAGAAAAERPGTTAGTDTDIGNGNAAADGHDDDGDDDAAESPAAAVTRFDYTVSTNLTWHSQNVASLALIKRVPLLDTARPLAEQLHFVNLFGPAGAASSSASGSSTEIARDAASTSATAGASGIDGEDGQAVTSASAQSTANPYESLHSIVHLAVQPYFEAYVSRKQLSSALTDSAGALSAASPSKLADANSQASLAKKKKGDDASSANTGIPVAKKKFAELELSLLHLQQNVEIPEIVLGVHPVVMRAVEKVRYCTAELHCTERQKLIDKVLAPRSTVPANGCPTLARSHRASYSAWRFELP